MVNRILDDTCRLKIARKNDECSKKSNVNFYNDNLGLITSFEKST